MEHLTYRVTFNSRKRTVPRMSKRSWEVGLTLKRLKEALRRTEHIARKMASIVNLEAVLNPEETDQILKDLYKQLREEQAIAKLETSSLSYTLDTQKPLMNGSTIWPRLDSGKQKLSFIPETPEPEKQDPCTNLSNTTKYGAIQEEDGSTDTLGKKSPSSTTSTRKISESNICLNCWTDTQCVCPLRAISPIGRQGTYSSHQTQHQTNGTPTQSKNIETHLKEE